MRLATQPREHGGGPQFVEGHQGVLPPSNASTPNSLAS